MKYIAHNPVRPLVLAMLIALGIGAATVATAADGTVFSGRYIGPVAELSADERAWFRSHWQQMPPEEREAVRNKLRKDWRDTPPEQRTRHREELVDRIRDNVPNPGRGYGMPSPGSPDGGYGRGYETRQWEYPDSGGGDGRGRR